MAEDSGSLRVLAARCRRLARGTGGSDVARTLTGMAEDYERQAEETAAREAGERPPEPANPPPLARRN